MLPGAVKFNVQLVQHMTSVHAVSATQMRPHGTLQLPQMTTHVRITSNTLESATFGGFEVCGGRCDNVIASTKRVFMGDALLGHFHTVCVVCATWTSLRWSL